MKGVSCITLAFDKWLGMTPFPAVSASTGTTRQEALPAWLLWVCALPEEQQREREHLFVGAELIKFR